MKIIFLHLSDFHFSGAYSVNSFQTGKIVDSLKQLFPFDRVCIILSGDLTQTGEREQFAGVQRLVGHLISNVKDRTGYQGRIDVLCVPGNHDINHNGNPLTSRKLQSIRKAKSYDKLIDKELIKLDGFYEFSAKNRCFVNGKVYCQNIIRLRDFEIEVNLLNSAIFSILDEDKGLHYIPQQCINNLCKPTGADFVITIMHHAPEWYNDSQKVLLENAIFKKSSIVFIGHEHYSGTKTISSDRHIPTFIQAGGCLCQNDDWTKSEFHSGILDTKKMEYTLYNMKWNIKEQQYENIDKNVKMLALKPSAERKITVQHSFIEKLVEDEKHDISDDFRDYYTFPRIQAEDQKGAFGKEILDEDSLVTEVRSSKRMSIVGGYNSGKTSLLKYLFLKLTEDYCVIFCDVSYISGKDAKRTIKFCFEEIYGDNPSDYERFSQLSKDNRMLLIDNVDQISPECLDQFISEVEDVFEYVIFTSIQVIDFDLVKRIKSLLKASDYVGRYKLTSFYTDKRDELIYKIVEIKIDDKNAASRTAKLLSDAIKTQRNFVSLDPDFIIKYVEYFCNNIGEASYNDSSIFSKVFESSLVTAIAKYQTNRLSVDKTFMILSKIAHYIHFNKAYPIPHLRVCEIISEYNNEYGTNVSIPDVIEIILNSKILVRTDDHSGYRFSNKNYLAFFVAREVNNRYHTTGDDSDLTKLLQCACFGINSDILLFISFITDNIKILRHIIHMVNKFTSEWSEFRFDNEMPQFLLHDKVHKLEPLSEETKRADKAAEIEAEKRQETDMKAVDIYDYSDDSIEEFANQIIRACKLLSVVAKCLPSFEHLMLRSDKEAFVEILYQLPNKIFSQWAKEVDKDAGEIIKFFRDQAQDQFIRQKNVTDDDILAALQWVSMSLFLELYNLVVSSSVKENTFEYLDSYNHHLSETYSLEHLMMIERKGLGTDFADTAMQLSKTKKGNTFATMLARIVQHALVYMDNLGYKQQQRLKTEYFPAKEEQKKLLAQRGAHLSQKSE